MGESPMPTASAGPETVGIFFLPAIFGFGCGHQLAEGPSAHAFELPATASPNVDAGDSCLCFAGAGESVPRELADGSRNAPVVRECSVLKFVVGEMQVFLFGATFSCVDERFTAFGHDELCGTAKVREPNALVKGLDDRFQGVGVSPPYGDTGAKPQHRQERNSSHQNG
jgi:hypothetical protein